LFLSWAAEAATKSSKMSDKIGDRRRQLYAPPAKVFYRMIGAAPR